MIGKAAPVVLLILVLALACPFAHAQQTPAAPAVAQPAVGAPAVAVPAGAEAATPVAAKHKASPTTISSPAAIAVAGDFVYVVQGNTLYQFAVDGLRLVAQTELAAEAHAKKKKKANALQLPNPGLPNAQVGPAQPGNAATGANPPAAGNQAAPAGNAQ